MLRFIICLSSLVLFFACSDPCSDVTCLNDGVCIEGSCDCAEGYEGTTCETEKRENLLGTWSTNDYVCGAFTESKTFIITASDDSVLGIEIFNQINPIDTLQGEITDSGFSVPPQAIAGGIFTISGSGSLMDDSLEISFTVDSSECLGVFTK